MRRPRSLFRPVGVAALLVAALAVTTVGAAAAAAPRTSAAGPVGITVASGDAVGITAGTAGCGRAPGLASGTRTVQSGGRTRSYILRLPDNYQQNQPYRLVLGFHWWGGTAVDVDTGQTVQRDVWSYYGLRRLADNSTIFVAPQGIDNGWANTGGMDVTFVDDLLRQLDANLCIETTQRFALGFSYGAAMSYALACARADVFRAVALYGPPRELSGCSGGTQPIAYFGAHGVSDVIASGRSMRDRFVRNNGCTPQNPPEPAVGSLTHRTTAYSGCRAGYPVVWAAFDGGHIAAPQDGAPGDSGTRTWLPGETWDFFTQFGAPPGPDPTTPPPSPTTPPPGPTTSPPATGACTATYQTIGSWPGGFQGEVTVRAGSSAINGWTTRWTLAGGQGISQSWNGALSVSGSTVTVRNVDYNGSLPAGGTATFGFIGTGSASSPAVSCSSP
ncbi:poly(3-hydroxybutyrate) depolymerase [Micromonospora sp. Llam0]|uniref:cellulose binding domain-containing protein n=1 Tax=Micromonospora sp. Llam0 TaxID=2485143 RepID=UPI000F4AD946|nr:cellulose binding domain-containing protein [Micromonospora sp. Llam0]ROO58926.1 poly(3-hydroxybutyrate) depolymerase [Micromonospora sp. Llam0]